MRSSHCEWGAGAAGITFLHLGCLPASTFTSARPIPEGTFEHVASVDVTGSVYDGATSMGGIAPAYGLRYGASDKVELGGRISPASFEASAKIGLVRSESFALALAPRLTGTAGILQMALAQHPSAVYARVPVLATLQVTDWATLTPRAGIGFALGRTWSWSKNPGDLGLATDEHDLHDPVLEGGGTLLVRVAPTVSLGFDGYVLSTFLDRQVLTGGGGAAVLFTPRQATQR